MTARATWSFTSSRPEVALVVDDSPDQLQILSDVLSDLGHHVTQAPNGSNALRLTAELKPIAGVIDIGLPDIDGYQLARRFWDLAGAEVLLIATSEWRTDDDEPCAREAGFVHHFTKPADIDAIHELLRKKESSRG